MFWMMTLSGKKGTKAKSVYEEKMTILLARSQRNRPVAGIKKKDTTEAKNVERTDLDWKTAIG